MKDHQPLNWTKNPPPEIAILATLSIHGDVDENPAGKGNAGRILFEMTHQQFGTSEFKISIAINVLDKGGFIKRTRKGNSIYKVELVTLGEYADPVKELINTVQNGPNQSTAHSNANTNMPREMADLRKDNERLYRLIEKMIKYVPSDQMVNLLLEKSVKNG